MGVLALLGDGDTEIGVSASTIYEVGAAVRRGALRLDLHAFEGLLIREGFTLIPIDTRQAAWASTLAWSCLDPWLRIQAASAHLAEIPLVTGDLRVDEIGVERLWR